MLWLRWAAAIAIFTAGCAGLGALAELRIRRHKWPDWVSGLAVLVVALVWPVITVVYVLVDAQRYLARHPHDDAPGMVVAAVIFVGAPFLFCLSLPPAVGGVALARRRSRKLEDKNPERLNSED